MNSDEITTTSVEMVNLMVNNFLETKSLGNTTAEDFSGLPAISEGSTEVFYNPGFSADQQITEEEINPSNVAFMNIDHANDSKLKVETRNDYFEIEHVQFDILRNTPSVFESKVFENNAGEDFSGFPAISEGCTEVFHNPGFSADRQIAEVKINLSKAAFMNNDHANNSLLKVEPNNEYFGIENIPFDIPINSTNVIRNKEFIKTENSEAINESNLLYDVTYKDWKIKNEELDIKEEDIKKETSIVPYCGQEKQNDNQRMLDPNSRRHNQSISESNISMHFVRHKNPKDINMFKCDMCDYQSTVKFNLRRHLLRHKNLKDVNMFKCDQCDYQAMQKSVLKTHFLRHKNPKDVDMFKCDQCEFETFYKSSLKTHFLRHKNPENINMFKCDQCDYQAILKSNFTRHLLRHESPKDVNMFKCDQCEYQTFHKSSLKTHFLRHKNSKDINMFKCDQCDYQAIQKFHLKRHLLRHKSPKGVNMFKCDQCEYQTFHKSSLKTHFLGHKNPKNINIFK